MTTIHLDSGNSNTGLGSSGVYDLHELIDGSYILIDQKVNATDLQSHWINTNNNQLVFITYNGGLLSLDTYTVNVVLDYTTLLTLTTIEQIRTNLLASIQTEFDNAAIINAGYGRTVHLTYSSTTQLFTLTTDLDITVEWSSIYSTFKTIVRKTVDEIHKTFYFHIYPLDTPPDILGLSILECQTYALDSSGDRCSLFMKTDDNILTGQTCYFKSTSTLTVTLKYLDGSDYLFECPWHLVLAKK